MLDKPLQAWSQQLRINWARIVFGWESAWLLLDLLMWVSISMRLRGQRTTVLDPSLLLLFEYYNRVIHICPRLLKIVLCCGPLMVLLNTHTKKIYLSRILLMFKACSNTAQSYKAVPNFYHLSLFNFADLALKVPYKNHIFNPLLNLFSVTDSDKNFQM